MQLPLLRLQHNDDGGGGQLPRQCALHKKAKHQQYLQMFCPTHLHSLLEVGVGSGPVHPAH